MPKEEMITFDIRAYNRVANKYRKLASDGADMLDGSVEEFVKSERRWFKARPYPPKRPNQKYVRTGELANRWKAEKRGASRWQLVNRRSGVVFVVGDKQAKIHKNRWYIAADEALKHMPQLTEILTDKVTEVWPNG